jgi:adenosylmethionine-8-amino-7-oxononanoate aminotransferase
VAIKIALQYWLQRGDAASTRRRRFLALTDAYHGDTVGAVSTGGIELFHSRFRPLLFEVMRVPAPYCYRCPLGLERSSCGERCIDEVERVIAAHGDELAAVVIEPGFQGAAGIIPYPPGYLQRLAAATRAAGALLICDEVAAGLGRTGALFASEAAGIAPDLLCIAKALTGGYLPLAATLASEEIFRGFLGPPAEGRTFFHGHTYTGNALGAAAALATLELLTAPGAVARISRLGERLGRELERLRALPAVGDVRHCGLAAGVELVADRGTRRSYPASERRGMRVCRAARERGVFLRPLGDTIVLMPPFSISEEEIVLLVDAVAHGIEQVCGDASPGDAAGAPLLAASALRADP